MRGFFSADLFERLLGKRWLCSACIARAATQPLSAHVHFHPIMPLPNTDVKVDVMNIAKEVTLAAFRHTQMQSMKLARLRNHSQAMTHYRISRGETAARPRCMMSAIQQGLTIEL